MFENRWPGLSFGATGQDLGIDVDTPGAIGRCDVVVYGTSIDDLLYDLSDERVALLISAWGDRYCAMKDQDEVAFVLPFRKPGRIRRRDTAASAWTNLQLWFYPAHH